jgi:hypothetical protein
MEELTFAEVVKKFPPFCGIQIFVAGYTGPYPEPEGSLPSSYFHRCILILSSCL